MICIMYDYPELGLLGAFVVNVTLRLYPWSPSNPCPLPLTIHLRNYDIVRNEYKCSGCKFYSRKYIVDKKIPISMSRCDSVRYFVQFAQI